MIIAETDRLRLRQWRDTDREPFAAMNADPDVMRYFPRPYTQAESDKSITSQVAHIDNHGWGLLAVETCETRAFCGFVGLARPTFEAPFLPGIEIGWRLAREHWGKGYATEAARAVVAHAFGPLGLDSLVSFTVVDNIPSRRVMERIGMHRVEDGDFFHPGIPEASPLAPHVLYRQTAEDWAKEKGRL